MNSVLVAVGNAVLEHLRPQLDGYQLAYREPLDAEVAPRTAWLSTDDMRITEHAATGGTLINVTARLYLAVFYEVSQTTAHYASVLARREQVARALGGAARDLNYRYTSINLIARLEDESTLITAGYYMSSTPLGLEWEAETL